VAGFEPATTRTPSVCATRLRYTPTLPAPAAPAETQIIIMLEAKLQLSHAPGVVARTAGRNRSRKASGASLDAAASRDSIGSSKSDGSSLIM
jgi:hypothetical protein